MYLLLPARHHAMTTSHADFLASLPARGSRPDGAAGPRAPIQGLVFAVTSSNHAGTRRNPLPFHLRALAINDFAQALGLPAWIFGIEEVGKTPRFAEHLVKSILHQSEGQLDLGPGNSAVFASRELGELFRAAGFEVLPAELEPPAPLPYEVVEAVARAAAGPRGEDWAADPPVARGLHPSSADLYRRYGIPGKLATIFADLMLGEDGDLTETRDYGVYVRQMDEVADLKWEETRRYVQPGRVGDIGCAVGSWIKRACGDPRLAESDFYGIEVARALHDICVQRVENREFPNPNVFFSRKNAVTGLVFPASSMDTIHTGSLTHEIESYGGRGELLAFVRNRLRELKPGGVWINRDVVGPEDGDRLVLLALRGADDAGPAGEELAAQAAVAAQAATRDASPGDRASADILRALSPYARFLRFARDFRAPEGFSLPWRERIVGGSRYIELGLAHAMEYLEKKDYLDNWTSEMHETFCFFGYRDWAALLEAEGFEIDPESRAFRNEWLVEHRFAPDAALFIEGDGGLEPLDFPVTHMVMVARRPALMGGPLASPRGGC